MAFSPPGETRRKVYRWVREQILAGHSPALREVQQAFGFRSLESARAQLEQLVRDGLLTKREGETRGYRLASGSTADDGPQGFGAPPLVPLLGRVQAGLFTSEVEDIQGYLPLPGYTAHAAQNLIALRVRGESMTGAGIFDGDIVVVRRQPSAVNGDIVVAAIEGTDFEATIKTFHRRGNKITLQAAHPNFAPLVPQPSALKIIGKVLEVRRYLEGQVPLLPNA